MKNYLFMAVFSLFFLSANAQLKVLSTGDVTVPINKSLWITESSTPSDNGYRLRLLQTGDAAYIDFYNNLYFRSGSSASSTKFTFTSDGKLGIGTYPSYNIDMIGWGARFSYPSTNPLLFCVATSDPRICSDNKVVFYNLSQNGYIDIHCRDLYELSDFNAKENFTPIIGALDKIKQLNGVNFAWKNDPSGKRNVGLIAQDVEKVIPEVIAKVDSTGEKTIAYTKIIPYLIEAIKQQQIVINSLQEDIISLKSGSLGTKKNAVVTSDENFAETSVKTTLYQNQPNPFKENTEIKFYIPEIVKKANLNIYNMNGSPIKSFNITTLGAGSITISGSELKPGIYLYSLITDGVEIDTKRMILTD